MLAEEEFRLEVILYGAMCSAVKFCLVPAVGALAEGVPAEGRRLLKECVC